MQQTSNYNLNLPEGTDVVNPLVDYNPNFTVIDGAMKANADRTVGRATCVKSGTTHAVTRNNTGSNIINFTATGDWNTGDSMTVDGNLVSVYLPDGSAPLTGAYVINSEVFAIINGSRVTLYGAQELPDDASDINYDNTGSGLTASNVQGAIDEVENNKLKIAQKTYTTAMLAPSMAVNVQLDVTVPGTREALIILAARPSAHTDSALITQASLVNGTYTALCVGTGAAQVFTIDYIILYR